MEAGHARAQTLFSSIHSLLDDCRGSCYLGSGTSPRVWPRKAGRVNHPRFIPSRQPGENSEGSHPRPGIKSPDMHRRRQRQPTLRPVSAKRQNRVGQSRTREKPGAQVLYGKGFGPAACLRSLSFGPGYPRHSPSSTILKSPQLSPNKTERNGHADHHHRVGEDPKRFW